MRVDRLPPNSVSAACYRTDPKTGEILAELEDRENHAIDALRYALEGQRSGSTYDSSMRWVGTPVWGWR
jgi:hypothetical protein